MALRILCKPNSSSFDLLSPKFVKDGTALIASPLTRILNYSLKSGELSEAIKVALVTSIHKITILTTILYEYQSSFRSIYSVDACLVNRTDYIKQERDKERYMDLILLDL